MLRPGPITAHEFNHGVNVHSKSGSPHKDSYRPDLPFRSSDAKVAVWARTFCKKYELTLNLTEGV